MTDDSEDGKGYQTELPGFSVDMKREKVVMSIDGKQYAYDPECARKIVMDVLATTIYLAIHDEVGRERRVLQYIKEHPGCRITEIIESMEKPKGPYDYITSKIVADVDHLVRIGKVKYEFKKGKTAPMWRYHSVTDTDPGEGQKRCWKR